jgi:hypothetical protein
MPDSPVPVDRPRSVVVSFWCWVAAAVLTAAFGMLLASDTSPHVPLFIRLAGGLLVIVGLAQAFLARQARTGKVRLAMAGVGLAMATVAFLAVLLLFGASVIAIGIVAVIMILLITGSVYGRRPAALQWYEGQGVG